MSDTITLVRFRLQEGKTSADWLKINQKINEWAKRQPGFLFRSLSETPDGEWFIITRWENPEKAAAAENSFREEMVGMCEPLFARDSIQVSLSKVHTLQCG